MLLTRRRVEEREGVGGEEGREGGGGEERCTNFERMRRRSLEGEKSGYCVAGVLRRERGAEFGVAVTGTSWKGVGRRVKRGDAR